MAKFIVEVIDRYEIEAESIDDAQRMVREEQLADGSFTSGEYMDGTVTIEES
jgi:hypothetical protein